MTPTVDEKDALLEQLDKLDSAAWMALMIYCLPKMLDDQLLISDILCREAERRAKRASHGTAQHFPADHLPSLLQELGLRITLAETGGTSDNT